MLLNNTTLSYGKTKVKVKGKKGEWKLYVNNEPFQLKGVGCGRIYGTRGENYLKMAKDMGANAVRTWNFTPGRTDREFIDHAYKLGLMVASWIWFNPTTADNPYITYKKGSQYYKTLMNRTEKWVKELKDHPALLMWGVGNEVIMFSHSEEEKIAFAKFLNDVCKLIHKLDPDHPVIYASAFEHGLPYLAKYTPELDIVGINMYTFVISMHKHWERAKFDKPYLFTEFGPVNKWSTHKDKNGYPLDPYDHHKAKEYKRILINMKKHEGSHLGGFMFFIGEVFQWTDSWWPLHWNNLKRATYWEGYQAYTGKKPSNKSPRIKYIKVSKVRNLKPFEEITVKVKASDPDGDPLIIDYDLRTMKQGLVLHKQPEYWEEMFTPTEDGFKLKLPSFEGDFILYVLAKDNHGNVAVANRTLVVGQK